jgi:hypothetical protein
MKNILLTIFALLYLNSGFCENTDSNAETKVNQQVYEQLTKENFVKLNKITREGKLAACELEFQYAYKDFRAKNGALISTMGSFSAMYHGEKVPSYALKLTAYQLNLLSENKWVKIEPAFTNIKIKNIDFGKYKTADFSCENGGKCTGYSDTKLKLNLDLASIKEFDPDIYFSFSKGGFDHLLKLSKLMPIKEVKLEFNKFRSCHEEILIMVSDDLRKIVKQ